MGAVVTEFGAADILGVYVGVATAPVGLYLALLNEMPDETVNGTSLTQVEVAAGIGYSRYSIGLGVGNWALYGESVGNANELTLGPSTGDWGIVRGWALCTAATDGDVIIANLFPEPYRVLGGRSYVIEEGSITWSATSPVETIVA